MDAFLLQIPGELSKSGYDEVRLLQKKQPPIYGGLLIFKIVDGI